MAAYKTGRSRTITFSGNISGKAWQTTSGHPPHPIGNTYELEINANWITDGATKVTANVHGLGMDVTAEDGLGGSDSDSDLNARTSETVVSGTYELSVEVEEWAEYSEGSPPTYGGASVDGDVPGEALGDMTERLKVGGSITATITLTDGTYTVSATATTVIASADPINGQYGCSVNLIAGGLESAQDASIDWAYLQFEVPAYSRSGGGATIAADTDECSVVTDASAHPNGEILVTGVPPQGYVLEGRLRADNDMYAGGGTVRIKRKDGETYAETSPVGGYYSSSYTQRTYSISGECDGVPQDIVSLAEHTPLIYHWLVPASGEDITQWRLMFRGAYYTAGTITQAATVAVDGGFTFGDSGTTRTLTPAQSMAGYRYLLVQTDQAAKDVTLAIGNKSWTVETTGAGLAIFDLCGPSNINLDVDVRDSRWPIPTDVDYVDADGAMWGVVNVASYTLTAETGVTCVVGANEVYLSRDTWATPPAGHSKLDIVPPFVYWVASGAANVCLRPFFRGDTDGRRSLEEADWSRVGPAPYAYVARTIEDVLDEVNAVDSSVARNPGWTAVLEPTIDVADGAAGTDWDPNYLNKNRNASWIEGSGIAYYGGAWVYGHDRNAASTIGLTAQMLCDKVSIYPMCGDAFGLRTGGHQWEYGTTPEEGRIELRGGRHMRAAVWGVVLEPGGLAQDGVTVTVSEVSSGSGAGSGASDIRGEYLTGTPWAKHGVLHAIATALNGGISTEQTMYGGLRRRVCFCGAGEGDWVWLLRDYTQRLFVYHVEGGVLKCREYGDNDEYLASYVIDASAGCRCPQFHLVTNYQIGTYLRGTSPMVALSAEHGRVWQLMTIPGTYEALASCPHLGRLVAFGWKTNAWYCRVGKLMPDGTYSWSNEVSLGVTTTKKAACAEMRHDGALEFVYLDSSGQPQMLRGYAVALDGTGTWVA